MQKINYLTFIRLLHIDGRYLNPGRRSDYFGFKIERDGVQMLPPDDPARSFSHRIAYRFKPDPDRPDWEKLAGYLKGGRFKVMLTFKRPEKGWSGTRYKGHKKGWSVSQYKHFKFWPSFVFLKNDEGDIEQSLTMEDVFSGFNIHELPDKPVLAFPCSPKDLLAFLAKSGLDCMVDPDDLAEIVQKGTESSLTKPPAGLCRESDNDSAETTSAQEPRPVTVHPTKPNHPPKYGKKTTNQGGRPPSQLFFGIEAFYLKIREAGDTIILQPQALHAFLDELRRAINSESEVYETVRVYIRKLEKRSGRWLVFVHDPPEIKGKPPRNNEKPRGYAAKAVSKIINKLREKYPLE